MDAHLGYFHALSIVNRGHEQVRIEQTASHLGIYQGLGIELFLAF